MHPLNTFPFYLHWYQISPDSKLCWTKVRPRWILSAPHWINVGLTSLAIWISIDTVKIAKINSEQNHIYHQISNIRCTKSQNLNVSSLIMHLSLPNLLKPCVNLKMKMCSANRRCSNYFWVINNLIAHTGVTYIRDLQVEVSHSCIYAWIITNTNIW